jgi:hypothetical protein
LQVVDHRLFETPLDMRALIPPDLVEPFTVSDLAALGQPHWLAQKMVYCLREMGAIAPVGKRGRAILYEHSPVTPARPADEGQDRNHKSAGVNRPRRS